VVLVAAALACGDPPPTSTETMADALAETPEPEFPAEHEPRQEASPPPPSSPEPVVDPGRSLTLTEWTLIELLGQRMPAVDVAPPPRLEFDRQDFTAWDGCNRMLGSFHQDGTRLEFDVSIVTREDCPGDVAEGGSFRAALERVRSWNVVGDALALFDADGILLARFDRRLE
jgi:heat shock protein HslJ